MRKLTILIILFVLLAGCSQKELQVYVEADKLTYEAIADEYVGLVKESKLDDEQKDRRYRLVKTWKMRIDNALAPEEEPKKEEVEKKNE